MSIEDTETVKSLGNYGKRRQVLLDQVRQSKVCDDDELVDLMCEAYLRVGPFSCADSCFAEFMRSEDLRAILSDTERETVRAICVCLVGTLTPGKKSDEEADRAVSEDAVGEEEEDDDDEDLDEQITVEDGICSLCERTMPLTRHHLFPKKTHKKMQKRGMEKDALLKTILLVCRPCHSAIHRLIDHETLSSSYNSLSKLLDHAGVFKWAQYASKQKDYSLREVTMKGFRYAK